MAQQAYIVTDISFGDAGKGTTVDYLVRQASSAVVVRHNGGSQAAHNVITPNGDRHHTFAQFGSGSFVPGVQTYLSRYMLLNPLNMFTEAAHLQALGVHDIWDRLSVDRDALVVTPWQRSANRLRELARDRNRHGSTGQGIGETMADSLERPDLVIRVRDLCSPQLPAKLDELRQAKLQQLFQELDPPHSGQAQEEWALFHDSGLIPVLREAYKDWSDRVRVVDADYLSRLSAQHELLVFEGAQGVLLDEWYGFHPYTTWSTTTHANALQLLADVGYAGPLTRLGVLRAYTTRHGAGPFVTEDPALAHAIPDYHNGVGEWQGTFRIGHLDLPAHRYALAACKETDALVVTGLDRMAERKEWQYCAGYRLMGDAPDAEQFFSFNSDGLIADIKLGIQGDLDRQARLTELLFSCQPVCQPLNTLSGIADKQAELLRVIEGELALPVTLASFGPTAADKRLLAAAQV